VNRFGRGRAYYLASRTDARFHDDFLGFLAKELALPRPLQSDLPAGVTAQVRRTETKSYLFLLNFLNQRASVALDAAHYVDTESGASVTGSLELGAFGSRVLVMEHGNS
jgi:beta-galactosidase